MVVKVSKPEINVREKISELDKPSGTAGQAMLAAETPQEQFNLIGAGRRNLIINGGMKVAQRGTSATAAVNVSYSTVDRFKFFLNANGYTTEQSTGHLAATGHDTALKISVTTADTSIATGDYYSFLTPLEAQNLQHLQYGTSSAKEMTLSFWVRATKAGTQAIFVTHEDNTRYNFVQEYTINQSDTWEYKTITIPPLTASAISNDNGTGIRVGWILAYGSTYQTSTIGSWITNTNAFSTANAVNNMDSTSNTFYLTGVQLELGKVATPFEHRSYGEELALCYRYYQQLNYAPSDQHNWYASGVVYDADDAFCLYPSPVQMRALPTVTTSQGNFTVRCGGVNVTNFTMQDVRTTGLSQYTFHYDNTGGLTTGDVAMAVVLTNHYIYIDAEL